MWGGCCLVLGSGLQEEEKIGNKKTRERKEAAIKEEAETCSYLSFFQLHNAPASNTLCLLAPVLGCLRVAFCFYFFCLNLHTKYVCILRVISSSSLAANCSYFYFGAFNFTSLPTVLWSLWER